MAMKLLTKLQKCQKIHKKIIPRELQMSDKEIPKERYISSEERPKILDNLIFNIIA